MTKQLSIISSLRTSSSRRSDRCSSFSGKKKSNACNARSEGRSNVQSCSSCDESRRTSRFIAIRAFSMAKARQDSRICPRISRPCHVDGERLHLRRTVTRVKLRPHRSNTEQHLCFCFRKSSSMFLDVVGNRSASCLYKLRIYQRSIKERFARNKIPQLAASYR